MRVLIFLDLVDRRGLKVLVRKRFNPQLGQLTKMMSREQVSVVGNTFVRGLRRILGEKLYGLYIYGAAAFPDSLPAGDIDFHVILKSGLTDHERSELESFHEFLAEHHPPLGGKMDGYYILLADARGEIPPRSQMWGGPLMSHGRCTANTFGPDAASSFMGQSLRRSIRVLRGRSSRGRCIGSWTTLRSICMNTPTTVF